jgi:hypothetical protein
MNFQSNRTWGFLTTQVLPVAIALFFMGASAFIIVNLAQPPSRQGASSDFREAADQTRRPNPKFVSKSLVGIKFDHPVTVVTFTQNLSVPKFQEAAAYKDIWVTEVPYMKAFCQEYMRLNGADREQLSLRLKERLGLPPDGDYDTFVELTVNPKDTAAKFFRPCGDPSLDTNTCQPPTLPAASDVWSNPSGSTQFQEWMLRNYYSNYAGQEPYPWTALGYTFDWARKSDSEDFERFGESEFVIPKGAPVHFVAAASPAAYCALP